MIDKKNIPAGTILTFWISAKIRNFWMRSWFRTSKKSCKDFNRSLCFCLTQHKKNDWQENSRRNCIVVLSPSRIRKLHNQTFIWDDLKILVGIFTADAASGWLNGTKVDWQYEFWLKLYWPFMFFVFEKAQILLIGTFVYFMVCNFWFFFCQSFSIILIRIFLRFVKETFSVFANTSSFPIWFLTDNCFSLRERFLVKCVAIDIEPCLSILSVIFFRFN